MTVGIAKTVTRKFMKKSEMVEIITKIIANMRYEHIPSDQISEEVLYKLEAAGMIPPNQYACINEFRFEWEDEDEA